MRLSLLATLALVALPMIQAARNPESTLMRGTRYRSESKRAADARKSNDSPSYLGILEELHRDFPENSRWLRYLATEEAKSGHRVKADALLQEYAATGSTLDFSDPALKNLEESAQSISRLRLNAVPVEHSKWIFTLSEPDLIAEDIAYDRVMKRFFVSSVRKRKIISCDLTGKCEDFITSSRELPLGAILALGIDHAHQALWATTAGINAAEGFQASEDGRSALLRFNLSSRRLVRRYDLNDGNKHALGDMTVSSHGDVYVSDGLSGDVYVVSHTDGKFRQLTPAGIFVSPQTPALSTDEKLLYIPDYTGAIAIIRLRDRSVKWMKVSHPVALEGIDGMYMVRGNLVVIQNGTMPERLVRFRLATEDQASGWEVLEAGGKQLGDPTHGVIAEGGLYFIANSGWDRMADDGKLTVGEPAQIRRLDITW